MADWVIIHLEINDYLGSICEKITNTRSLKIILNIPRQKIFLENRLDMELLSRHARHMGYQLALVSRSPEIINNANLCGIPVFPTIEKARTTRIRSSKKSKFRLLPKHPDRRQLFLYFSDNQSRGQGPNKVWRISAFITGLLSVVLISIIFLPQAQISLKPALQKHDVRIPFQGIPEIASANIFGEIPVKLDSITLRGRGKRLVSGNIAIPFKKATGIIDVRNLSGKSIVLPAGTIVRTQGISPVRFKTIHPIQVQTNLTNPEFVRIEALETGDSGNVPSNSVQTLEGDIGLYLSINNPSATTGGEDINENAPSTEDITGLQDEITNQLIQKALESFGMAQKDRVYLEDSIIVKEISDIVINPEEGIPSDDIAIELTAAVDIWYYRKNDMERIVQMAIQTSLPEGMLPMENSMSIVNVGDVEIIDDGFKWQVDARVLAYRGWKTERILPLILGKKLSRASQVLEDQLDLQEAPSIIIWPKFWKHVPLLPFRIKINNDQNISS